MTFLRSNCFFLVEPQFCFVALDYFPIILKLYVQHVMAQVFCHYSIQGPVVFFYRLSSVLNLAIYNFNWEGRNAPMMHTAKWTKWLIIFIRISVQTVICVNPIKRHFALRWSKCYAVVSDLSMQFLHGFEPTFPWASKNGPFWNYGLLWPFLKANSSFLVA